MFNLNVSAKERFEWFCYRWLVPASLVLVGFVVGLSKLQH